MAYLQLCVHVVVHVSTEYGYVPCILGTNFLFQIAFLDTDFEGGAIYTIIVTYMVGIFCCVFISAPTL